MAELKTKENDASVQSFLDSIEDDAKRADCVAIAALMEEVSGAPPRMWGKTIVGFGHYHYRYASGREGEWMRIGFAPRKRDLTLYIMDGYEERAELLTRLGKHKLGKSCLYIKRLTDVDATVLRELVTDSLSVMAERYPKG
ncbi:MAG: DUF1801 domain-containing protein [Deltaproteobacteria bacterium]|nr:DUF1801 domain-containing protein [Deltaproteobacteria bacterium]